MLKLVKPWHTKLQPTSAETECKINWTVSTFYGPTESPTDLLGLQQGAARHLPPLLVIRDQFVIQQSEDTVGFHNGVLKLLILLWWSRRYSAFRQTHACISVTVPRGKPAVWKGKTGKTNDFRGSCLTLVSGLSSQNGPELLALWTLWVYRFLNGLHLARLAAHVFLCLDEGGQIFCLQSGNNYVFFVVFFDNCNCKIVTLLFNIWIKVPTLSQPPVIYMWFFWLCKLSLTIWLGGVTYNSDAITIAMLSEIEGFGALKMDSNTDNGLWTVKVATSCVQQLKWKIFTFSNILFFWQRSNFFIWFECLITCKVTYTK